MSLAEHQGLCRAISTHRAKTGQSAYEVVDALRDWRARAAGRKDDQERLLSNIPEDKQAAKVGGETL